MWVLALPIAYLVGTFPSAALVARANGVDIRTVGSGNPGASNVTRVLGWRKGFWVFFLDAAKGALCAGAGLIIGGRPAGYALGAAAVVGHVFPVWYRFKGGKGVATGAGAFMVLLPVVSLVLAFVWAAVSKLTKKASLASIAIVVLVPVGVAVVRQSWWEVVATIGLGLLVMARHMGNIKRLVTRREHALT
jgi:glycerol-3-phosphate acyltransferase PlsY